MSKKEFTVEIVIPVRFRENYDVMQRAAWRANYNMPSGFSYTFVDYGSDATNASLLRQFCETHGFKYLYIATEGEAWNASKARNEAIKRSESDYILFEDLDLISHVDFYQWIKQQVDSLMIKRDWEFLVVPVSYLTPEGSQVAQGIINDDAYEDIVSEIYNTNSSLIEFHAPASSYLIASRRQIILAGGYDEGFDGWGFEDSDFWLRMLRKTTIEKPRNFYKLDTRNYSNQVQWEGWRALFRVYADLLAHKGIYAFHVWHEVADHKTDSIRKTNRIKFLGKSHHYSTDNLETPPLWNEHLPSDLFISRNPHSFNEALFHHFTNPLLIEGSYIDPDELELLIQKYNVKSIIMDNPYARPQRLKLRDAARALSVPVYVVERGALPGSIYIDKNGFCAESSSYDEINWQHIAFDNSDFEKASEYTNEIISGATLEPQSDLIGGANLKQKIFGHSKQIKILFLALQSPSDTTTNYFCDSIETYDNFLSQVSKIPKLLPKNWRLVYKNHPLSLEKASIEGAICIDDYHVGDILQMCDAVTLINSGVGVLSIIYGKPVFYFGKAFYACNGLNSKVYDAEDLVNKLKSGLEFDRDKAKRFICYLVTRFYSFASWSRQERPHTSKAKMSISKDIQYKILRVDGHEYEFTQKNNINVRSSILFDRYRLDDYLHRQNKATKPIEKLATKVQQACQEPKPHIKRIQGSSFMRKFRKLVRDPSLFFKDAITKRLLQ